jgi:hypothetical protein
MPEFAAALSARDGDRLPDRRAGEIVDAFYAVVR